MGRTRYIEKENKMGLKIREKKEGKTISKFVPHSNFIFHPVAQLGGEKDGFLVEVKTFPHGTVLQAYVPSNPKRDELVFHLNKALCAQGGGGLSCSLPETVFKSQFVKKVLDFQSSNDFTFLKAVKTLGKVKDCSIWVLTDKVQFNKKGKRVTSEYVYVPDDEELIVQLPKDLSYFVRPLSRTLQEVKKTLNHNYPAAIFCLGGLCMINHAESIEEVYEGCPAAIMVGPPGRGKTTALKLGLSSIGLLKTGMLKSFTSQKLLQRSNRTTMGVYIDDPSNPSKSGTLKEIVVNFFNRGSSATIGRGVESMRCGLMIASNDVIDGKTRELRRVVYIPFLGESIAGDTIESVQSHVQVKKDINSSELAAAVPAFIAAGGDFASRGWNETIEKILPEVQKKFRSDVIPDCYIPYSMLIWFTKEIYKRICGMTEDIHFIDQYFDEVMVPFIMAHQPRKTDDGTSLYSNPNEHDTEKFELFQSLSDRVKMVIQGSSKDEVRKLMRLGRRQGSESITLHPSFFDNATFAMHQLVSHAIKSGLGSSEPRRMSSQKSVRCLVLDLKALEDCTSDLVRDFFSDDVNKTRLSPTKRMRTTPQEKREINSAPEPPAKKIKGASYQKRSMGRARSLGFKRRSKRR